ncbi:hypothetical protein EDC94DRAFT_657540 [Helicostylum pulchrum]|nr:hypothetical protein EDC94DRAFT_657540 [Helicostylum pulchrum]
MSLMYDGEHRSNVITQFRKLRDGQDIMLLLQAINIMAYLDRTEIEDIKYQKKQMWIFEQGVKYQAIVRKS